MKSCIILWAIFTKRKNAIPQYPQKNKRYKAQYVQEEKCNTAVRQEEKNTIPQYSVKRENKKPKHKALKNTKRKKYETLEGSGFLMIDAVSCGGVVIHRGKVLLLYKNQNGKYIGWVLPKGQVEGKESFRQTALREVREETRVLARIIKYIGKTQYNFRGNEDIINKTVHWYLMSAESFFCKPQTEEHFSDAGYYKKHEAYHLLKFHDEKQIIVRAYNEYDILKGRKSINLQK